MQADSLPAEPRGKAKNIGVGSLSLLQGIFLAQQLNRGPLHCRQTLYQLSYARCPGSSNLLRVPIEQKMEGGRIHSSGGSEVKASACNAGDPGSIPGSGRSPGEGNGNPLQYSCLGNPMDGGVWWPTVHRVAKSRTRLSDFSFSAWQQLCSLFLNCF